MPLGRDVEAYRAVFDAVPAPCLLLDVDLVVLDANQAYLRSVSRNRSELVGRPVLDAFAGQQNADSSQALAESMQAALSTGQPDRLPLLKYDVEARPGSGDFAERWWSLTNIPITKPDGTVTALLNTVEDLTEVMHERSRSAQARVAAEDLLLRTQGLEADLRERSLALTVVSESEMRASRRLAGLVEVGLELARAQTVEDLTRAVIEGGLAALGADGGAVAVRDDTHGTLRLRLTDSLGADTPTVYGDIPLDGPLPASVAARTGQPVLIGDRTAGLAFSPEMAQVYETAGKVAWAAFPLQVGSRPLGSITISWDEPQEFTPDDVVLLQAFAAQCAQALDRLLSRDAERETAAATARLSEALQRSLLTDPVQPDHLQIAVRYVPAGSVAQVGGDWYDAFMTRDGSTSLVIGDVTGHDRDAAAAMGQVRNVLRGIGHALVEPPAAVLGSLDLAMQNLDIGALTTATLAMVEQTDEQQASGMRSLRWSNAGHPPPLLIRPDGTAVLLDRPTDLMLGLDPDTPRHDHVEPLPPGTTVVLYTDGLFERRDEDLDDSLEALREAAGRLGDLPLEDLCDRLLAEIGDGAEDDVALLAVRAYAEDQPRPPAAGPETLPPDLVVDQS